MSLQDGISDMLTRIRNASMSNHVEVSISSSKINVAVAKVLKEEGYIADYREVETEAKPGKSLIVTLKYYMKKPVIEGLKRISKPSCRIYCASGEIPKIRNGLGTVILSTHQGVLSGRKAALSKLGGEIICYVW